jgi:hypothetical protein
MFAKGNEKDLDLNGTDMIYVVLDELENTDWYSNIIYFLNNFSCRNHLNDHRKQALRLKAAKYSLFQDGLGWRYPDGFVLMCVSEEESKKPMEELHSRYCGGHYVARTTTHKVLRVGYYRTTLFSNVHRLVRLCL